MKNLVFGRLALALRLVDVVEAEVWHPMPLTLAHTGLETSLVFESHGRGKHNCLTETAATVVVAPLFPF